MSAVTLQIAKELQATPHQVTAAVALLDDGATVPFIARYRKEATGGLDDTQLRTLSERLTYLRELEDRRTHILTEITSQGLLTDLLARQIHAAENKQTLEDLYLPYKPKRRTKAMIAREAGLGQLAEKLLHDRRSSPVARAKNYLNPEAGFGDEESVLAGAQAILAETWSEDATLLGTLRNQLERRGIWFSKVTKQGKTEGDSYRDYFEYQEPFRTIPSHRALAMFRGAKEGMLRLDLLFPDSDNANLSTPESLIYRHLQFRPQGLPGDPWLAETIKTAWKSKLHSQLKTQLSSSLRERAETEAIEVFAKNLKDLLLAPPAGQQTTMGLDPGYRTGVKVVVVDATGSVLGKDVVFPHPPQNQWQTALKKLSDLCKKHGVSLVSIGNGTASRETERLVAELKTMEECNTIEPVVVSEAGASVYSASALAAKELPQFDVSYRGAISIARRLQDPLAELVKIDPKAIGVGQYQHDLSQTKLSERLKAVVEDCVNGVGVILNTASAALLTYVSGLSTSLAQAVVDFRTENGPFKTRQELLRVPRLGPKAFEQCAGFLRIRGGSQPLDASAVHPESYPVVHRIAKDLGLDVKKLIGREEHLKTLNLKRYVTGSVGLPTLRDIVAELEKPGRDPRPHFQTASFAAGVEKLEDLKVGMVLEGVVRNVANFGAFVDIGVHQDGLVHISAMADRFVKDPRDLVRTGQIVKVRVTAVDVQRKRIALSMRMNDDPRS